MKFILSFWIACFFLTQIAVAALAATTPTFPYCPNPGGTIKAKYDDGAHGIVGDMAEHKGRDTVYITSENTLVQCFCPNDNSGIQTNWWKFSNLTDSDIQKYKNDGWIYIPNGSLWGLENRPYLAKNSSFSCNGSGGTGGGDILSSGASTTKNGNVLGLANTGDLQLIVILFAVGSLLIVRGILLWKRK